ncbi:unnamed protein product [Linum trigynum]|uniref:Uncharacterized protein n=1 Tax=Linum trigynum TaxID=586398 RepID=A0AAV2G537_9ROSI
MEAMEQKKSVLKEPAAVAIGKEKELGEKGMERKREREGEKKGTRGNRGWESRKIEKQKVGECGRVGNGGA